MTLQIETRGPVPDQGQGLQAHLELRRRLSLRRDGGHLHAHPGTDGKRLRRAMGPHGQAECLDWMLILARRHLERVLSVFVEHYQRQSPKGRFPDGTVSLSPRSAPPRVPVVAMIHTSLTETPQFGVWTDA